VEVYARVRRAVEVEGMSVRQAAREFGLSRSTIRKMLEFSVPPGYQRKKPAARPKLGPWLGIIDQILEGDEARMKKQRHTARRIYDRLKEEHAFTGGYTMVKDYVRAARLRHKEVFVPLTHPPGDGERKPTEEFRRLKSHYLFEAKFGRPGKATTRATWKGWWAMRAETSWRRRRYAREKMIFDPLHYLALLEQKTHALDQAAPLEGWVLPPEFDQLRRQMEARLGKRGRREYVQVLRLLETFSLAEVSAAIQQAQLLQAISFDAVKHLVLCAIEQRSPKLDLENYPHLPTAAVALTHELMEARDDKRLLRFQKHLQRQELLIVDELGFVPLSKAGAEMLFEVFSQRYERGSTLVTSNLPFAEWTEVLGSERLTGALLDRLTHHVHILEMNGESYRLKSSKQKRAADRAK